MNPAPQPVTTFARLRELEAKASPGPWEISGQSITTEERCIANIEDDGGYEAPAEEREVNAALIAESRNALPALLDSHAELVADRDRLEWLIQNVSGAEWRRLGIVYSAGCTRADIDAASAEKGAK